MGGKHTHGIAFPFLSCLLLRDGMFVSVPIFYLWSIWYSITFFLGCLFQYHIYICYGIASSLFLGMFVFSVPTFVCDLGWITGISISLCLGMFVFSTDFCL